MKSSSLDSREVPGRMNTGPEVQVHDWCQLLQTSTVQWTSESDGFAWGWLMAVPWWSKRGKRLRLSSLNLKGSGLRFPFSHLTGFVWHWKALLSHVWSGLVYETGFFSDTQKDQQWWLTVGLSLVLIFIILFIVPDYNK